MSGLVERKTGEGNPFWAGTAYAGNRGKDAAHRWMDVTTSLSAPNHCDCSLPMGLLNKEVNVGVQGELST